MFLLGVIAIGVLLKKSNFVENNPDKGEMEPRKILTRELREPKDEDARRLQELMNHLTTAPRPEIDTARLAAIVESPHTRLLVAEREGAIVGALTLTHYLTPVSEKVWIEDVVVDPSARGLGVGRAMVEAAVELARQNHPSATIILTSNPSRTTARQLYTSVGFEEYNTGVFRIKPNQQ